MPTLPHALRALRHRNYRLYFSGQVISLVGTWMQQIAMSWLAYRLTGSPLVLGVVAFSGQIPILLLAPFGGVLADRFDRRRLLMVSQSLALTQALLLSALTATGRIEPWHLALMALFLGTVNAVDVPARQALTAHLVADKGDLSNAIALNSFTMNGARLVGPSIAGLTVALLGEALCFLLNALSYLAVLLALSAMRLPREESKRQAAGQALREGFAYAFGTPWMRNTLFLVASLSFFITSYATLMPVVAHRVFGGGAHTYGLLMACAGGGALLGTLFLASRKEGSGLARTIAWSAPMTGMALAIFSLSSALWLAIPALAVIGFGMLVSVAGANTRIQTGVKNELRGRVMALFSMAFLGISPLGALAAGGAASLFGTQATLLGCGVLSSLIAFALARGLQSR